MNLTLEKLAKDLKLSKRELLDYITKLECQCDLNIENYYELTRYQYDVVRGSLDIQYMAKRLKRIKSPGVKPGTVRDHTKAAGYPELVSWLEDYNLHEYSTKEVRETLPENLRHCGVQTVAAAMRELRYESKVLTLTNEKQGRRWIRMASTKPSFM